MEKQMPIKTYLWIEDSKAGCVFWQRFMQQLCPEVVVESKKNCSELVRAVRSLGDSDNRYIIALDNSFDNLLWDIRKLNIKEAESALYANA